MIDFNRFWAEGSSPYGYDEDDANDTEVPPGVTKEEIRAWEHEHGVTLPEPIRTALGVRNGGFVRNAPIQILPLDEIVPVDDDFWEWTEIEPDEAPDHSLMFLFGDDSDSGGTLLLNFNTRGAKGAPSVYMDHHGESTYRVNDTIDGFFNAALASSDAPSVDWKETESGISVVARETIDLSDVYGGKAASEDQVLARDSKSLTLFTRERSPQGETLTRTTLPLPLDADWAVVRPYRPAPISTFVLHLQPQEIDGIVAVESRTDADGRWKNSTSHGVPIYVTFESIDRARLDALRTELFGAKAAAAAQARQDSETALEQTLNSMPPEQRAAAMLQATLGMKEESDRQFGDMLGDLGQIPAELAEMANMMKQRLEEMSERIRQKAAANPPDPETMKRIEGYLRDSLPD
jgi:hypothetical protein